MYKIYNGIEIVSLFPELKQFSGINLAQNIEAMQKVIYIASINRPGGLIFRYHFTDQHTGVMNFVYGSNFGIGAIKMDLKPLSVNEAWKGRRFKTDEYKVYERAALLMLPKMKIPDPPFEISYEFGMSNVLSDFDNPVKPFTDIIQKKYGINDRDIYRATIDKKIVQKGQEYVKFEIKTLTV